ncbi:MAG: tetratricopeptide repeat protein [Chitinophagales bacterium]|nr:tetratricopeptide repeat protein [Chitinophagales bacterium]
MKNKITYIILFILLANNICLATTVDENFERANTYYKNKQYTEAVNTYIALVNQPIKDASLYYNLGNTYFQLKQYPNAILFYEKALLLDGSNKKIQHNLKIAQNKALTKIENKNQFFVVKAMVDFYIHQQQNFWTILFLISLVVFVVCSIIYFLTQNKIKNIASKFAFLFLFTSIILFVASYRFNQLQTKHQFAIVMENTKAHSKPTSNSQINLLIEAGNKVKQLDYDANWIKVELPNGKITWLNKESLQSI